MKRKLIAAGALLLLLRAAVGAQEITLEEITVESVFISPLELPLDRAVQQAIDRWSESAQALRALDLEVANRSVISSLLDLTKAVPIPLGASESRVDTFFLQNSMRPDLNPQNDNPLFTR